MTKNFPYFFITICITIETAGDKQDDREKFLYTLFLSFPSHTFLHNGVTTSSIKWRCCRKQISQKQRNSKTIASREKLPDIPPLVGLLINPSMTQEDFVRPTMTVFDFSSWKGRKRKNRVRFIREYREKCLTSFRVIGFKLEVFK